MPLTARKIAHIKAKQALLLEARSQPVYLTCKRADGTTYQKTVNAIWREMADYDPTLDQQALNDDAANYADIHALFLTSDIDLATLRSVVYATVDPVSSATATRFRLTSVALKGMMPGGDRYYCTFNRQR
jgi:hypothetical protein